MAEQLELHPAWPRLTDDQRRAVNEVWDDMVVPALEEIDVMRRKVDEVRLEAQDDRAGKRYWRERAERAEAELAALREQQNGGNA